MSEYIYASKGTPMQDISGEIFLPRKQIVRCRDCAKWHHIDTEDGIRYGECDEWKRADSYCVPATNEDGFCAWSARMEVNNGRK